MAKNYNFEKFTNGSFSEDSVFKKKKFDLKKLKFEDNYGEVDPIKENNSKFLIDNDDAIIVNLKKNNSNN